MSYADISYYRDTYKGVPAGDTELARLLSRGADDLDNIAVIDFDNMTAESQDLIKKANCMQTEHLLSVDGLEGFTSIKLGNLSLSGAESNKSGQVQPDVKRLLSRAGVEWRATVVCGNQQVLREYL